MSQGKSTLLGATTNVPSPNQSFVDAKKRKEADDKINMQASITVPSPLRQSGPQDTNKTTSLLNKNETTVQSGQVTDGNKGGKVESTGGVLAANQQNTARKANEPTDKTANPQKFQEVNFTFEELISNLFMLPKIFKNSNVSEGETKQWIEVFRLTQDFQNREASLEAFKKQEMRSKLFENIKYLNTSKEDKRVLAQIYSDFGILCMRLIEKYPYLSNQACVLLITKYIQLNMSRLYRGKFQYEALKQKGTQFENSKSFYKMLNSMIEIKEHIFLQYEKILKYFIEKIRNKQIDKCLFLQKIIKNPALLKSLVGNIWHSFSNIVQFQLNQPNKKYVSYDFQINLLASCLNLCFQIGGTYFTRDITVKDVFPLLKRAIPILQRSTKIEMSSIDKFVLNLVLVQPFTIATFNSDPQLNRFLSIPSIEQRFNYLFLLNSQVHVQNLYPLKQIQNALFLQNYLKLNQNMRDYDQAKQAFIFDSICQMFQGKFEELTSNKSKYKYIWKYIDFIVNSILDEEEQEEQLEEEEEQFFDLKCYLNVCRLAKLIANLCMVSTSQGIHVLSFTEILRHNVHTASKFISKSFELIRIADDEQKGEYNRIETYLSNNSMSTQSIYEFFYKLTIYDPKYLETKQKLIVECGFESLGQFYQVLVSSYILNFVDRANIYHLNMQAYSALIQTQHYVHTCKRVAEILSSLRHSDLTLLDQENNQTVINHLQFAVENMLSIKDNYSNNLWAYGEMIIMMLDYDPMLLQSPWIKAMVARMKKLTNTYHPIVLYKYTETLLNVLRYLNSRPDYHPDLQAYFEFKYINDYLHNALAFEFDRQSMHICNKYISCRKYSEVALAVGLIKNMAKLYLRQTENHLERIPYEVKRIMEKENRGSDYQLVFTKEATSYAFPLAILLQSKELNLDTKLKHQFPWLRQDVFECLISLKKICDQLRYEMNFRVSNLYNRRTEIQMNENLKIQSNLIESIKRNPTYLSFEYLMGSTEGRITINREIFAKLTAGPPNLYNLQSQSRFVLVYWQAIAQGTLKITLQQGWNNITDLLDKIKRTLMSIDLNQNRSSINTALAYLFEFSIAVKKKNIDLYARFLLEYYNFFIDYNINILQHQEKSEIAKQAMTFFFSKRSLLPSHLFQQFMREDDYHQKLQQYILRCLDVKEQFVNRKSVEEDVLLMVERAIVCSFDVCVSDQKMQKWMQVVLEKVLRRVETKSQPNVREIVILMLLSGKLETQFSHQRVTLKGNYWQLIANCIKPETKVAQLLLLQLQTVYSRHQIFFVSFCNFFSRLVKTQHLQSLLSYQHIKLQRTFFQIMQMLLIKSIQEHKSYYVIWIVEILSGMVQNQQIDQNQQQNVYFQTSLLIFNEKVVVDRVNELLRLLANRLGVESSLNKPESKHDGQQKFTLAMKQELLAYVRLMTILYFSQSKDIFQSDASNMQDSRIQQTINKRQIEFQLLAYDLVPLFAKLLNSNDTQIDIETEAEQKLSNMRVDKLRANKIQQSGIREVLIDEAHRIWSEKFTVLNLLDEMVNYQLISLCSVWVSLVLNFGEDRPALNAAIYKDPRFDAKANHLVYFLQSVIQKLQDYRRNPLIMADILKEFDSSIYNSLALGKQMLFTNCNSLSAHIDINYQEVTYKLSEVVFVVYKMLENIFSQKKALKSSSVLNFKKIIKNLKSIEEMIQQVDSHFVVEMKSASYRTDSENISRNYTIRNK